MMQESVCYIELEFEINAINVRSVNTCVWMLTLTLPTVRSKAIPEMLELFGTIESTQHSERTYSLNATIPPKDVFSYISGDGFYTVFSK